MKVLESLGFEVVFHADWWKHNSDFDFGPDFYFDPDTRVTAERRMNRILSERFPGLGISDDSDQDRPVIGPLHFACGYLIPSAFGCEVTFLPDAPPEVQTLNMSDDEIMKLGVPDLTEIPLVKKTIEMMDILENRFGYIEGDVGWDGLQNTALYLRGQELFIDYMTRPDLVDRLLTVIFETQVQFVDLIRNRTGTSSISINRDILKADPKLNVHSSCSLVMVSPEIYETYLLPFEKRLAERLPPYGIHHCGGGMEKKAKLFKEVEGLEYIDVGYGSDLRLCRKYLPGPIFSTRLSPVELEKMNPDEVIREAKKLVRAAGDYEKQVVCCVNMSHKVPDENIFAIGEAIDQLKKEG